MQSIILIFNNKMKTTIHNYFSLKNKASKYRDNRTKLLCRSVKDDNMYLQNKIQNSTHVGIYSLMHT